MIDAGPVGRGGTLGPEEGRLLADLVRELGRERFATFWTSPAPPDAGFAESTGEELAVSVGRWVARTYGGETRQRPTITGREAAWLGVALPLLIVGATRRRDHVLSERLIELDPSR